MKRIAAVFSAIFDVTLAVLFSAGTVVFAYLSVILFGASSDVVSQPNDETLGPLEALAVGLGKGFAAGLTTLFAGLFVVITIVALVFAVLNIHSSIASVKFVKNGVFFNNKQKNRMRAAMGLDFFIGIVLIASFAVFVYMGVDESVKILLIACLCGGLAMFLSGLSKIPAVRTEIPKSTPTYGNGNNRW